MGINRRCRICCRYVLSHIAAATLPANDAGERMQYTYTYDSLLHTYPAAVANSFGETMSTDYDARFGKPTRVTYPGGASMTCRYDFAGRLASVSSPLGTSGLPTLEHRYHPTGYYHNGLHPAGYAYDPSPSGHPYSVSLHRAMFTENLIRIEHGLRQRTYYGLKEDGKSVDYNSYPAVLHPVDPFLFYLNGQNAPIQLNL